MIIELKLIFRRCLLFNLPKLPIKISQYYTGILLFYEIQYLVYDSCSQRQRVIS